MGHKLLAFRLRTAFFEAFLLDYFHWSAWKCFYMKNWNLYFIFHHEKYCWMDFYKYAFCFLRALALFFLDCFYPTRSHQRLLKFFRSPSRYFSYEKILFLNFVFSALSFCALMWLWHFYMLYGISKINVWLWIWKANER